jgi:serine/threonine-protein kinase
VLELVDGDTLADRIARGRMPSAEAIAVAKQILDGLEAAHAHGIVHRDLKPSNIKLRPDGTVKILDFGLAKALGHTAADESAPQQVSSITRLGVVTGTPAYMSPEQAGGLRVDARTDLWSFGCVFYEMLTGQRAFTGGNVSETLAAVMAAEPRWDALPRDVSPSVRLFLKRCLSKDPKQRIADARTMGQALEGAFDIDVVEPKTRTRDAYPARWRTLAMAGAIATLALLTGLAVWVIGRPTAVAPLVSRFVVPLPEGQRLVANNDGHVLSISRNGTHIAFAAGGGLWLRPLETPTPTVVRSTERSDAHTPFFSPDGEWVAYYDEVSRELKRAAVGGGLPVVIAAIDRPFGATWPTSDRILYGRGADGIWQVAPTSGAPEQVIAVAEGEEAHSPQVLPDGRVLFTLKPRGVSSWNDAQIVAQARGSTRPQVVVQRGRDARYLPTGHLVYASSLTEDSDELLAVRFDVGTARIERGPVPLVQSVESAYLQYTDASQFAVADNGTLVYVPRGAGLDERRSLVWVTRDGNEAPVSLELRSNVGPVRVSPDGTRIVHGGGGPIFVSEISRSAWSPIVNTEDNWSPIWTPDGGGVVFVSYRNGGPALFSIRADGTGESRLLAAFDSTHLLLSPGELTTKGDLVFTYSTSAKPRLRLLGLSQVGGTKPLWRELLGRDSSGSAATLVGDDWLAYQSDDSGTCHIYIQKVSDLSEKRLVSTREGGHTPRWSPDGRELFYRRLGDEAMMSVAIETTPTLRIQQPRVLFRSNEYFPADSPQPGCGGGRGWDVAPDGRFLMIKVDSPDGATNLSSIVVVQNWSEELKRLVAAQ